MPNRLFAPSNPRATWYLALCLGLFLSFIVVLPPASEAIRGVRSPNRNGLASATSGNPSASMSQKRRRPEYVPGQVLVRYRTEAMATRKQRNKTLVTAEGRELPIQVERFDGADLIAGLRLVHVAAEDTMGALEALKVQPDVLLYAEPNYIVHPDLTPNDPRFLSNELYGLTKIGAPTAWNTTTGSSDLVVGVIDGGIDINHPDLQANIWTNPAPGSIPGITGDLHGYDFANNSGTISADDHATHVAGTIGAVGNNGVGVVGVNWTVKLMSLKFIQNGTGSDADAIRACNYAKQMKDLFVSSGGTQGANVRVLNNSYGGGGFTQAFLDAIQSLNQSGILFVTSEGNEAKPLQDPNPGNTDLFPHYPSGYNSPNVVSVSATDSGDNLASFSNFGAQTATLGAPGFQILSTTTNNTYTLFNGTSMASPHAAGAAALLLAQNPNLTVQQLKSLVTFNGDSVVALNGKTLSGRRLNVANSFQALAENDSTPPGTATNLHVNSQTGRQVNLGWTASGDDGATGQAALYQLTFTDAFTGAVVPLKSLVPSATGTPQAIDVKLPYGHTKGTISLREFDNVGNEGTPATQNVNISFVEGNPYAVTLGSVRALSTGGAHLNLNFDDRYRENFALPFAFPFFGQNYSTVTISTNGNLYFSTPPKRSNGDADDVPSAIGSLTNFRMIAGLWDDIYLGTDQRADADVYTVQPDANTIIFRWQGVPCNDNGSGCAFGGPVNFEIELRSNGIIQTRYGSGNASLFPVVGISGGEPDPYVATRLTSEFTPLSLTNAQQVTYIPRAALNPLDFADFFVSQHYRDFLSREPEGCTLQACGAPDCGLQYWSEQLTGNSCNLPAACPDQTCVNSKRVDVSNAYFYEAEYQQTGAFAYRLYRIAYGNNQPFPNPNADANYPGEHLKLILYSVFAADRAQVTGNGLPAKQLALANSFVARPEFLAKYPASLATADQFVDAVLATIQTDLGVDLSGQRANLITLYGSLGRGGVMYRLADDNGQTNPINNRSLIDAEYNRAFVFTQYGGYLRRNADLPGFAFWLGQVNSGPLRDGTKQHGMVCSFITSKEYQERFSSIVSHNNGECPQ